MIARTAESKFVGSFISRRRLLLGVAGLSATAAMVGCAAASPGAAPGTTDGTASPGVFPVTVPGREGSVLVPAAPKNVVAVGYLRDTDIAIALGANVVGAVKNSDFASGVAPWQKLGEQTVLLDASGAMPYERIAALQPDLILASDDYQLSEHWPRFLQIAPTLSYRNGPGADPWPEMTARVGTVLGRPSEAATLVAEVQNRVVTARTAHPEFSGKTFTYGPVVSAADFYTTITSGDTSAQFLTDLGFVLSPRVAGLPASSTPGKAKIPAERLDLLDADVMIIAYATDSVRQQVEAMSLFRKLTAVRNGSYVALSFPVANATAFPSVLSIPYGLDTMLPRLAAAVAALS